MTIVIIAASTLMPDLEVDLLIGPETPNDKETNDIIDTIFKELKTEIDEKKDSTPKKKYVNSIVVEITINNANAADNKNFELNFFMKPKIPMVRDIQNFNIKSFCLEINLHYTTLMELFDVNKILINYC